MEPMPSQAPLSNWSNLRLILDWAYKGKPSSHGGIYLGHPLRQHLVYQRYLYEWFVAYARVMKTLGLHPSSIGELDTRVRDGIARLETQPLNKLFREVDLARDLRLSISQMNKLFCRCIGRTPKAYWEHR